jgi:hypothetical protein
LLLVRPSKLMDNWACSPCANRNEKETKVESIMVGNRPE